jgi:DNA-binding transcriptional ArsR family regulator
VRLTVFRRIACADALSCRGVCDKLAPSTLSHHLRILREAGLIRSERQGKELVNQVRREDIEARFPGLLSLVMNEPEPLSRPEFQAVAASRASA